MAQRWLSFGAVGWALLAPLGLGAAESIHLSPGHQSVVSAPGVKRAAIGNEKVADVRALEDSQQVIVTGVAPGSTDLILWFKDGSKKSYSIDVSRAGRNIEKEARDLLAGVEGVSVRRNGAGVSIEGEIFRGEDLEKVRKAAKLHPSVKDFTRVNADALDYMARQVTERLKTAGFEHATARGEVDAVVLEGEVPRKSDVSRAESIAKAVYANVTNRLSEGVPVRPLVLVDVKMMEVRKNSLGELGIDWPDSISAAGSATLTPSGITGSATVGQGAAVTLKSLVAKGAARILSNPRLLCRSGTPASFLAGGEIPIRLVGERTASVIFKPYGVILEITVQADRSRRVFLEIETKISDLDPATAVDGIPGILEHRVKTAANLRYGDTVVLGGLIEDRAKKNVEKVPLLGHIPILGELFKSRSFQKNESEFLVFLTPIPGEAGSYVHGRRLLHFEEKVKQADKEIELKILD